MTDKTKKPKTRKPNVGSDPTTGRRVWWWQVGLYAFAIGSSLILIGLTLLRLLQGRFTTIPAVAAVVVTGITWTLVTSNARAIVEPGGIKLGSSEPVLTEFFHQVAEQVNAPAPDAIYLVIHPTLNVVEETRFFGLVQGRKVLTVGLPFLYSMTRAELAATTAHHFGHFAEGEIEQGVRAMRALRAGGDLIAVERDGAVNGVYGSYARKMSRSVGGVGVAQEASAERAAVDSYGSEPMLAGLAKLDDAAVAWEQMQREYVVPALQNDAHPADLFEGFVELFNSPKRAADRHDAVERRRDDKGNEFDPHNAPSQRSKIVAGWPVVVGNAAVVEPDTLGSTLLSPEAKSAEIVVGKWAHGLMNKQTQAQSWDQLTAEVFSARSYLLAAKGFDGDGEVVGIEQLDQVMVWADADWVELDERLRGVKAIDGDTHACRIQWAEAVVTEAAASTDSYSWQQNWDGPPLCESVHGDVLRAEPIARLIVEGEVAQARALFGELVSSNAAT